MSTGPDPNAAPIEGDADVARAAALFADPTRARVLLADLGVAVPEPGNGRRPVLRFCLDWSEQRHHLGGGLGAALLDRLLDAGWVVRRPGHRAVRLTDPGADVLAGRLGVVLGD